MTKLSKEYCKCGAEIRKLIDWNRDPKNHLDGLKHANTTINALTQAIDRVREPLTVSQG